MESILALMRVLTAPGQDEFRSGQFFKSMVKTNLDGLALACAPSARRTQP